MHLRGSIPILLKSDKVLLIGAGSVALQKAKVLSKHGIKVDVVAKRIKSNIKPLCNSLTQAKFKKGHTKGYRVVVDATGSKKVLKKVKKAKRKHRFLLNVVDRPKDCDFYFMALTEPNPIQIAVTSHGTSPTLAKHLRDKCRELLGEDIQSLAKSLEKKRKEGIIDTQSAQESFGVGKVVLVGCGIGSLKDLTFRAYEAIIRADVYLYDHLLSDEIVKLLDQKKPHYFVGKAKGYHTKSQEEINALMLQLAKDGKKVARLKGGDPFVFGRGAEETTYLASQGIEVEVIPGISAATAAPLSCFIPVTARGVSDSFSVVSAHLRGNALNLNWLDLLKREKHTTVVLMGLSRAEQIKEAALELGVDEKLPCAIVSNAAREDQRCIYGTIDRLDTMAAEAKRPATIIFGEVVRFASKRKCND